MIKTNKSREVYDVVVDNKEVCLNFYEVYLERDKSNNAYYHFELIGKEHPEDIENTIKHLRGLGYWPSTLFGSNMTSVQSLNPLVNAKLMLLNGSCKILEKVYDEVIIEGVCYVVPYIVYIHMNTGQMRALKIGAMQTSSEELIQELEQQDFHSLSSSILIDSLDNLDCNRRKSIKLNRKKD